jgi:hypothetical protein
MYREACPADEWTTAVPETYCIEYGHHHLRNAEYAAQIVAHPPTILHVGWDTVVNDMFGPIVHTPGDIFDVRQLPPEELEARARDVRAFVDQMHAAGVETLMPYQSSMFFFGDHEKRTGFWEFYDHWDDYAEFGIGPRPATDPAEWPGQERRPQPGKEWFIYEPCINHPDWRVVLRMTTAWAARVGYDAMFSDVNAHGCHGPSCHAAFCKYLCAKYAPADLKRLFGFAGPEEVQMGQPADQQAGKPGEGLLWVETQRHWAHSFAELFAELTAAARQHVRGFFILPNSSSYANIDEMHKRRTSGQNIGIWAKSCPIFMYEKNEQPGRFGRATISDSILQYKYAFANGIRAGMLLYNSQEAHSIALSNAEAAALGGGSFIQGHYKHPEVRMTYRRFFESDRDLLAGFSSHAQVAVAFFYDELYWDNPGHLERVFCLKDYLCNHHILWDFIVEKTFARRHLANYAVVIVPDLQHLGESQVELLREYVEAGGGLVAIGEVGRFTDEGTRREALPVEGLLAGEAAGGVRSARCGRGWVVHAVSIEDLIERPAFEIFQLTEDEANDTAAILRMMAEAEASPPDFRRASRTRKGEDKLLAMCEQLAGKPLSVAAEGVPFTLRIAAYRRRDDLGRRLTVHLLNYDVPIHERQRSGPPIAATGVALRIPMPDGWQAKEARLRGPHSVPGTSLAFETKEGLLHTTVPRVEIYEVVEVVAS